MRSWRGLPFAGGNSCIYREQLVLLAGEIYRRERGALPPSDEALVGTYLKSLPDDGSADLADEMTPTAE